MLIALSFGLDGHRAFLVVVRASLAFVFRCVFPRFALGFLYACAVGVISAVGFWTLRLGIFHYTDHASAQFVVYDLALELYGGWDPSYSQIQSYLSNENCKEFNWLSSVLQLNFCWRSGHLRTSILIHIQL